MFHFLEPHSVNTMQCVTAYIILGYNVYFSTLFLYLLVGTKSSSISHDKLLILSLTTILIAFDFTFCHFSSGCAHHSLVGTWKQYCILNRYSFSRRSLTGISLLSVSVIVCVREGGRKERWVICPSVQSIRCKNRGIESGKWVANAKSVYALVGFCMHTHVHPHWKAKASRTNSITLDE